MPKHIKEKHQPGEGKDMAYYLTLFKIEGHSTWRSHVSGKKDGFDHEWSVGEIHHPKVTERKTLRIDRITGEFKEI